MEKNDIAQVMRVRESLDKLGAPYCLIFITKTMLEKSTVDATREIRTFLRNNNLHDYQAQGLGEDHRKSIPVTLQSRLENGVQGLITIYRSKSRGDERIWSPLFRLAAASGEICALIYKDQSVKLVASSLVEDYYDYCQASGRNSASEGGIASSGLVADRQNYNEVVEGELVSEVWSGFAPLWLRATGGPDVAAKPDHETVDYFPDGPQPAGISYAVQWFKDGVSGDTQIPHLLFLAGGPGGGKSHISSSIVADFESTPREEDGLAHRIYDFKSNGRTVKLINDASIVKPGFEGGVSLIEDLDQIVHKAEHAIICVNRGILVEELAKHHLIPNVGNLILRWIHGANVQNQEDFGGYSLEFSGNWSYLATASLIKDGNVAAYICVTYIDVCSLFEKVPVSTDPETQRVANLEYKVMSSGERQSKGFETPAVTLLSEVTEKLNSTLSAGSRWACDPFFANLESLSQPAIANEVMSVVRAAEVISGERMSYRQVWGLIARLFMGEATNQMSPDSLDSFLRGLQPTEHETKFQSYAKLRELARYRFSESLFISQNDAISGGFRSPDDPVTRITSTADPLKDSSIGVDETERNNWSSLILDAFSGVEFDSPLSYVLSVTSSENFKSVVTTFDWSLDEAFKSAFLSSETSGEEKVHMAQWYCAYLHRLFALSNGVPAHIEEVTIWNDLWKFSNQEGTGNFPSSQISESFRTLIRPSRAIDGGDNSSYISLWDTRTSPILGFQKTPKLAVKIDDLSMSTRKLGEAIFLILKENGIVVDEILIDFQLLREAITCIKGYSGTTEYSLFTAPRLERMRSSRLRPGLLANANNLFIVEGNEQHVIQAWEG